MLENKLHKKRGFTLAEVLITIGIIGVVAVMTIPNLIQKNYEKQTVARLKKAYAFLNQAYIYAKEEYGSPSDWYHANTEGDPNCNNAIIDIFAKYLKVSKKCYQSTGCFPDVTYKKIDGRKDTNWNRNSRVSRLLTSDGMSIFIYSYCGNPRNPGIRDYSQTWGGIGVDVNGFKKPNVFGEDMFTFVIGENGIFPVGDENWTDSVQNFKTACNRTSCYGHCEACSAWVLKNKNMDYLHCDNLDWHGKHSCDEK